MCRTDAIADQGHRVNEASDESLAVRAAQGCRASFSYLLERHYDLIWRQAWRILGSRERAEDVAQDVCVKLASAVRSFRADAKFTTWLHRIVYTTTLDCLRASQRMQPAEPSEIIRLADHIQSEAGMEESDDPTGLWTAVRSLPGQQRDAILFVYGEEMSHAEAASVMGCSEKTVSWHIHEAKKRLKILLEAVG